MKIDRYAATRKLFGVIAVWLLVGLIPGAASSVQATDPAGDAVVGSIDAGKAMKLIFKNYDHKTGAAVWSDIRVPKPLEGDDVFKENPVGKVTKVVAHRFQVGGAEKFLLITQTVPVKGKRFGRYCVPLVSGFIFTKDGDRWVMGDHNYYIGFYGEGCEAPHARVVKIGPEKIGVVFTRERELHGATSISYARVIGQVGRTIQDLVYIDLGQSYDRSNVDKEHPYFNYKATYEFIPGTSKEYYDLKIITKGTMKEDKQVFPVNKEDIYVLSVDKYIKK